MSYTLRTATREDEPILRELIARSIRKLGAADYSPQQIEAALCGAFGVDSVLISDGTYFVVVTETNQIVACGGWSRRRTLFGSDARADRDESWLDPATDAAKIRAFFVEPTRARRGIGSLLLQRCETEARRYGFTRVELMATLPGVKLYGARGYAAVGQVNYTVGEGETIEFVPMRKTLSDR